jgi:hypothetical protein
MPTDGASYALLTTGSAALADQPNDSESTGVNLDGKSVRGKTDFDVTILQVNLKVPAGINCLGFTFRFLSEEYSEFIGSQYNDAFIAELDESSWTTLDSSILAPKNFAFDSDGKPISVNTAGPTSFSQQEAVGNTYDEATPILNAVTPITQGAHSLYLSIFDQGDNGFDSAVMLDNLRLGTVNDASTDSTTSIAQKPATQRRTIPILKIPVPAIPITTLPTTTTTSPTMMTTSPTTATTAPSPEEHSLFPTSVPTPNDIAFDPMSLLKSLWFASLLLILFIGFPAELFNKTLEDESNYARIRGWFQRRLRWLPTQAFSRLQFSQRESSSVLSL